MRKAQNTRNATLSEKPAFGMGCGRYLNSCAKRYSAAIFNLAFSISSRRAVTNFSASEPQLLACAERSVSSSSERR